MVPTDIGCQVGLSGWRGAEGFGVRKGGFIGALFYVLSKSPERASSLHIYGSTPKLVVLC